MNNAIAQLINEINQELAVINNKTLAINVLCTRIQELHREGTREDYFTPIEKSVWCDIRNIGIPFMPQYPVGNYFLDFADPIKKIAIECDGKEFHDEQKDKLRDAELSKLGWTVYRLAGAECNRIFEHDIFDSEFYNDNQSIVSEWLNNSSDGFVYALKTRKYKNAEPSKFEVMFERDIDKTLYEHDSSNR